MTMSSNDAERIYVEELLPWYATGRLSAEERRRVEAYLEHHPELHEGLLVAREEAAANGAANVALSGPDSRNLERLLAALPAQTRALPTAAAPSLLDRVAAWIGALSPQQLGMAAAAVIMLVAVQAVTIGTLIGTRPGVYETATGATERPAANSVELLIGFKPEATMADTASFLKENSLTVIDGPRAGLFRVRAPGEAASAAALADRLKAASIVTIVVPGR